MLTITDREFDTLTTFVKKNYGIDLSKKRTLIEGRLSNTLLTREIKTFAEYIDIVMKDKSGQEVNQLLNKLTTNHTYFMREEDHFNFLTQQALPYLVSKKGTIKDLRIWSAGCSTGQEAYTMAIVINEFFGDQKPAWDTTILATDISTRVLEKGKEAIYPKEDLSHMPPEWLKKYFVDKKNGTYEVCDKIKKEVVFRIGNLMEPFNVKKPFDIIFCRNVMIYYDADTKNTLVNKFYNCTGPGGFLFVGLSESVNRQTVPYHYIKPAIYQREEGSK